MKFRIHRKNFKMTNDQSKLEQFLTSLEGEAISIFRNVRLAFSPFLCLSSGPSAHREGAGMIGKAP